MDNLTVHETTWRDVAAWRVVGQNIELAFTRVGGHLACLRFRDEETNPLWQPNWHAADPETVVSGGFYGGREASLLAAIVGHNLCLDRFGPPHPGETRPIHGEPGVSAWQRQDTAPTLFALEVAMPLAGLRARKRVQIDGDRVFVTHAVYNPTAQPIDVEWCEHINCGQPFIDFATCEAGIDGVWNWAEEPEPFSRFSHVAPMGPIAIDAALAIPAPDLPVCGDVVTSRVCNGFWSITNPQMKRRLTCTFSAEDFPWITLWTQHRSRNQSPWLGRERVRGMEVTTKPYPDGKLSADRHPSFQGVTTVCTVAAATWKEHPIVFHWERLG
jgi:hypothetical protein